MKELEFYDVKSRKKFKSSTYTIKINKRGMKYAESKSPSGGRAFRIIGK